MAPGVGAASAAALFLPAIRYPQGSIISIRLLVVMVCGRLSMLDLMARSLADDGASLEQAASSLEPKV
ncbi:MAG: hypothetical protein HOJ66_06480 [Acidiferrobacteraceae bacterium]|nr:hypothetical protein [Acidiferrobacteraceae bacterium]